MTNKNSLQDGALKLSQTNEDALVSAVCRKFDKYDDARAEQLSDIEAVRNAIYDTGSKNNGGNDFALPDVWELAQTLKSHLVENLYSHPDAMFDVAGATPDAQSSANAQKSMLVSYFEKMNISDEIEKIIDSIVETGEATLLVGWETKTKKLRRPQSLEEQTISPSEDGFVLEEKDVFDGPKVKFVAAQDFVFDPERDSSFENADKIYRTYATISDLRHNKLNNLLTDKKLLELSNLLKDTDRTPSLTDEPAKKGVKGEQVELLEFWGDITLSDGKRLENYLIVVAGRSQVIRFEPNPFIAQPFVHASIVKDPRTHRGVSPLKIALGLTHVSSLILNKQLDALSLIINPPYLAPKGCFKDEQVVSPGKIIEYDAALMPNQPVPLNFSSALQGWDFINFFKTQIESATGIYKTMAGNVGQNQRTATEVNYSANGQSARLNMIIDAINRKIIIPMVEKTALTIANFKLGSEHIATFERGAARFLTISDKVRKADYIYRYGDRKATIERKYRFKELFDIISSFAQRADFSKNIDFIECFKFALEQYGIENASNFLLETAEAGGEGVSAGDAGADAAAPASGVPNAGAFKNSASKGPGGSKGSAGKGSGASGVSVPAALSNAFSGGARGFGARGTNPLNSPQAAALAAQLAAGAPLPPALGGINPLQ